MSATGRGAHRVANDVYETPDEPIRLIADRIDWDQVVTAGEPCVGSGNIPRNCPSVRGGWITYEIRDGRDYLMSNPPRVDLTLTNPPYSLAQAFLAKILQHSKCVALLLRLGFHGSRERKDFLTANRPTHQYTLTKRPSFVDVCDGYPETQIDDRIKGCGSSFHKKEKIKVCPDCGGRVKAGTDASEYAWICWDRGRVMKDAPGMYYL